MTDYGLEVSPPSHSPTGDGFLGCYNDMVGDRVLTSVTTNEDLTPQVSVDLCHKQHPVLECCENNTGYVLAVLMCGVLELSTYAPTECGAFWVFAGLL